MTQQINLYDAALLKPRELVSLRSLSLLVLGLLLVLGALGAGLRWQTSELEAEKERTTPQLVALKAEQQSLEAKLQSLKPDAALERELRRTQSELDGRGEVLNLLQKGLGSEAMSFAEVMRGFARQAPAGVWLTGFKVSVEPSAMEIRGRTQNPALIPDYIRRLNDEKPFKGQAFAALSLQAVFAAEPTVAAAPVVAAATGTAPAAALAAAVAQAVPATPDTLSTASLAVTASSSAAAASAPTAAAPAAAKPGASRNPLYHEFVLTPVAKLAPAATEVKP